MTATIEAVPHELLRFATAASPPLSVASCTTPSRSSPTNSPPSSG